MTAQTLDASAAERIDLDKLEQVDGFARLTRTELAEFGGDSIAIANAMWRKGHPGWRERKPADRRAVYFALATRSRKIKIGVASDPAQRFRQIASMSPEPLRLLGVMSGGGRALEQQLHRRFAPERSHGEWFHASSDLLAFIEAEV